MSSVVDMLTTVVNRRMGRDWGLYAMFLVLAVALVGFIALVLTVWHRTPATVVKPTTLSGQVTFVNRPHTGIVIAGKSLALAPYLGCPIAVGDRITVGWVQPEGAPAIIVTVDCP
jgi:hypothetical protein